MPEQETTARLRELHAELHRIRKSTGRSQQAIAKLLGWSPNRMSRMETGAFGTTPIHVATLLTACQVAGPEFERVLALSHNVLERSWLRFPRGNILSDQRSLSSHETAASRIVEYAPLAVPELLQTESYLRVLLDTAGLVPENLVEDMVRARRVQQITFAQLAPSPRLNFFIPEPVLRMLAGIPQVPIDQLECLAAVAAKGESRIRIVPGSLGPAGLFGGPFRLLEYTDDRPVVQLPTHTATIFLQEPSDIATYRTMLARLDDHALDEERSRDLIVELAQHRVDCG